MEQSTVPQPAIDRVGPWLIILAVLAGILALTWDFLVSVLTVLFDPVFLSGFALTMLQAAVASTVGGGIGVGIAELALKSKRCTQSTIRFLRLGMWLPFFVAWAAPIWWIRWGEVLQAPLWAERILRVVIAISPNVIFAGCYYHLSARYILQLNQRSALSVIASSILLQAVLFSFLAQVFLYRDGWQWFPYPGHAWMARPVATILLVGGFLLLLQRITGNDFEKTAEMTSIATVRQLRDSNWITFLAAGILWFLCFAFWDRFYVFLRDFFAIAPFWLVIRASYRLLTTGSMIANMESTLWHDVAVSAQEITEGLLVSGVLAFIAVRVLRAAAGLRLRVSWLFVFGNTLPIVVAIMLMPWLGVNHWLRAVIVGAVSFLPFAQSLWGLRDQAVVSRILLALDNALPYAFVGMLFGELWAATAGLGFFLVVARALGNRTEALATSLITLGLMLSVSFILRFVIRRLCRSEIEKLAAVTEMH